MSIPESVLQSVETVEEHYSAGDFIFKENDRPAFYYQLIHGEVKLASYRSSGSEVVHETVSGGSCFGESMLILDKPYPVSAIAVTDCTVRKMGKDQFFQLMKDQPVFFIDLASSLSGRLGDKMKISAKTNTDIDQNAEEV